MIQSKFSISICYRPNDVAFVELKAGTVVDAMGRVLVMLFRAWIRYNHQVMVLYPFQDFSMMCFRGRGATT